jgi:hypothetical protein
MNPFQGGVKGALENSAEMATGLAVPHMLKNAYDEYKQGKEQGQGTLPSIAGAAGSSVGLDTAGIRERAQHGDVAGVVGEALPSIVSTMAAPEAGNISDAAKEGMSNVGTAANKAMRDPYTQRLTPRAQAASKVAGAVTGSAAGALAGGPWGAVSGGYAGYRTAPQVLELAVPKQEVGPFSKIPGRMPKPAVPAPNVPARIAPPEPEEGAIAAPYGRGGESQIGSNAVERQVQTIVQKNVVTPDEQSFVERNLGPNARMRPGEGITDWRARVTGLMKAARARTK